MMHEFKMIALLLVRKAGITVLTQRKYIQRLHSSQNKSHARLAILRMRNFPASTVKFFYKEIDGESRIFVIKTAILTKLSG
jgi:hypothetical protein